MKSISLILWDFDGTLSNESPEIKQMFADSARKAVQKYTQTKLSDQVIDRMLSLSRHEFGDSFTWLGLQGVDQGKLHYDHHQGLNPSLLKPDGNLIRSFKRLEREGIASAIISHGHMSWTTAALERCGLKPFFPDDKIITAEQIGFHKKHRGPEAFNLALEQLQLYPDPEEVAFVEDKAKNLYFPKTEPSLGWETYLVNRGKPVSSSHVDVQCETPSEVINNIIERNYNLALRNAHEQPLILSK